MAKKEHTHASSSEQLPLDKHALWEQKSKEIDKIEDKLGHKIDEGIKETVIVFQLLGISTTGSCEGHIDWGVGAPWVDVEAPDDEKMLALYMKKNKAFDKAILVEKDKEGHITKKAAALYQKSHKFREEIKRINMGVVVKAFALLEEFYRDRQTPFDRRLIFMGSVLYGNGRIQSQGATFQEVAELTIRQQKLTEYQEEMRSFTKFLKEKFFADESKGAETLA